MSNSKFTFSSKTVRTVLGSAVLASSLLSGCVVAGGDDAVGGGGSGSGSGSGSGASGAWHAVPLIDDTAGSHSAYRAGNDLVTGIYFTSPDRGFVVTTGDNQTSSDGGAVFAATGDAITSIAYSGKDGGPSLDGSVDFVGIDTTPTGFIAMSYAAGLVAGDASGHFSIVKNGNLGGIERVTAFRETSSGTLLIRDTGVVSTSPSASGPSAMFTDIWAPNATQQIPSNLPADMCQSGPWGNGVPTLRYSSYIAPDKSLVAYVANRDHYPQVCLSTNGGRAFYPALLPNITDDVALDSTPSGVLFTSATNGLVWWASPTSGAAYIQRTTDAGHTWKSVALPAAIASHAMKLTAAFFAPDGQHGWIAGYDHDDNAALLVATTDGGASWTVDSSDLAAKVDAAGGGALTAGFALDATHIWVGGKYGLLMARD